MDQWAEKVWADFVVPALIEVSEPPDDIDSKFT